jgi:hypothetical protein
LLDGAQPWLRVRGWLHDLAEEMNSEMRDGTLPQVAGLDRIWITNDGRAVLLEFPAPGAPPTEVFPLASASDIQRLLASIADAALSPVRPLHASALVETLRSRRLEDPALIAGNVRAALTDTASVSPRQRFFSVALGAVPALLMAFVLGAVVVHEYRWFDAVWAQQYPELPTLRRANDLRVETALDTAFGSPPSVPYSAMNTHIAGYYPGVVEDDTFWKRPEVQAVFWPSTSKTRSELRRIVHQRGAVTREELRQADARLAGAFGEWKKNETYVAPTTAYLAFTSFLSFGVAVSLLWTLITGTPLGLRLCGLSVVRWSDGKRVGRLHAALRFIVSWVPAFAALTLLGVAGAYQAGPLFMGLSLGICLAVFAVALLQAVRQPERGIADRICRTAIVPL